MFSSAALADLESVAHVIQVALTPIFLLSGIAGLLNVFANRLARVADRVDLATTELETAHGQRTAVLVQRLAYLRRRSRILDVAVVLGTCGGIATCCATVVLFIGALRDMAAASLLFGFFAGGLLCTVGALTAFLAEMLMASRGLRRLAVQGDEAASRQAQDAP